MILIARPPVQRVDLPVVGMTSDGSLQLHAPASVLDALCDWLPSLSTVGRDGSVSGATPAGATSFGTPAVIRVTTTESRDYPGGRTLFDVGHARVWRSDRAERLLLGGTGGSAGHLDLDRREAHITCPAGAINDLPDLLMMTVGLLSGRLGLAMVHAGAVVGPREKVWLLSGSSGSGKSTATANLVRAGWDFLADDRVFLSQERLVSTDITAEGWLRPFMLETEAGADDVVVREPPQASAPAAGAADTFAGRATRAPFDPRALGTGAPRRRGVLGGLLFPVVSNTGATEAARLTEPEALKRLIRECPWLLADAGAAPGVLTLLREAARVPAYVLQLGCDTRRDHARLSRILRGLATSQPPPPDLPHSGPGLTDHLPVM